MISLTTNCGKSDTLFRALTATIALILLSAKLISAQEPPTNPVVLRPIMTSVLEQEIQQEASDNANLDSAQPSARPAASIEPATTNRSANPQSDVKPAESAQVDEQPQVLMRGQLHEAFAEVYQADPQPNPVVDATPPEPINEVPPEYRPEGMNVQWIPGYWAWDDIESDFIWISGLWRDVPPSQNWVPGYWEQTDLGSRWVSGFWTKQLPDQLTYLEEPPASLEQGPSTTAPADNFFYSPGNWVNQNDNYVWRPGYWQPRIENWVWIPARYVWTPRGCVYHDGYWDYEFDNRGVAFAPVAFSTPIYQSSAYRFQPTYSVNTGLDFLVHLFVRPNCNHYFYGDWYGVHQFGQPYRPWINFESHHRNYDPLLVHYNSQRFRHNQAPLLSWINSQHQHYATHREVRPRVYFDAHVKLTNSKRDNHGHDHDYLRRATLANNYLEQAKRSGDKSFIRGNLESRHSPHKHVQLNKDEGSRAAAYRELQRRLAESRQKSERSVRTKPDQDPGKSTGNRRQPKKVAGQQENRGEGASSQERIRPNSPRQPFEQSDSARRSQLNDQMRMAVERAKQQNEIEARRIRDRNSNDSFRNQQAAQRIQLETYQQQQQQLDRERRREEFSRNHLNRDRDRESFYGQNRLKEFEDARAASLHRQAVERARESRERASKLQLNTEQQRLLNQRDRTQQNREDFARNQQRQQWQAQMEANRARENSDRSTRDRNRRDRDSDLSRDQENRTRDMQKQLAREKDRIATQQKLEQSRREAQQKDLMRQQERANRAKADQERRAQQQAQQAREKSQRDAQARAKEQQRQADRARRDREDQQRKAADQQRQQQRRQEQEARKANRKKKK